MRRVFDVITACVLVLLLSPFFLFAAVLVLLDGTGGPVFDDSPSRKGLNGSKFRMYKFRTMVPGAHKRIGRKLKQQIDRNGGKLKSEDDPRITWAGRIIRAFDIDELPQLLNVLKGDMSLVGPRPYFAGELSKYPRMSKKILSVRPGITGTWQVSGRNYIPLKNRIRMDADYAMNRTFVGDLWILAKTPLAVVFRIGAW